MESKSDRSMEAKSILEHINFEFIFCLHLFCDTFSQIKIVSDYLQFPNSDIGTSCIMVESLIDYLKEFRTVDRLFNVLLEKVVLFEENNNNLLPEENLMCIEELIVNCLLDLHLILQNYRHLKIGPLCVRMM